ncbi:zinc finger CCCH domain-containing protein 7B-like [Pseudophryne corroboree]|uniref:zinc finger CCCH domain-containing protein 7B-like n=1 Tax=Pseudophryne corroboree TaxID=495146 RepID=UPI00308183B8
MSSRKGAKKKPNYSVKNDGNLAEHVAYSLLTELLARGVEQGTYRWCLQKNADPTRSVFISCVPTEVPDGVICSIVARTLNRGQVRIVDSLKLSDSIYQSLLVEAEGKIDSMPPTFIQCDEVALGYWVMVVPVEDNEEMPPAKAASVVQPPPAKASAVPPPPAKAPIALPPPPAKAPIALPPPPAKAAIALPPPPPAKAASSVLQPPAKAASAVPPPPAKAALPLPPPPANALIALPPPPAKTGLAAAPPPVKAGSMAAPPSAKAGSMAESSPVMAAPPPAKAAAAQLPAKAAAAPQPVKAAPAVTPPPVKAAAPSPASAAPAPPVNASSPPPPAISPPAKMLPPNQKARVNNPQVVVNRSDFSEPKAIQNIGNGIVPETSILKVPEKMTQAKYAIWEGFSMERQKRREDIEKGLQFIQSTIPFHGSDDEYKRFLQELVENLFTEGNERYLEGKVKLALGQYTEGLTVAEYAASEELVLSQELVCRLFVNRSCCYYSMGLFEKSLEDSEKALSLDEENTRALYRKAKALDKLGKHQEAYGCISHRILVLVQDESVTELAQELVQKLGLKQRRAYKRPQQELETFGLMSNGISSAGCKASNSIGSVDDIYTEFSKDSKLFPSTLGISCQNDSLRPAACPLPMASKTNSTNYFTDDVIGDELDSFLELEMASKQVPQLIPVFPTSNQLLSTLGTPGLPAPTTLPLAPFGLLDSLKQPVAPLQPFSLHLDTLDTFEPTRETLDSLDTFVNDTKHLDPVLLKGNQKQKTGGNMMNHLFTQKSIPMQNHISLLSHALPTNPLAQTYDFKQGCQQCYEKTGPKALDYTHREKLEHKCKKDLLLARMKSSENKAWLKIRHRPMKVNFNGPYMLCKDIQSRHDCKYGDNCTFAYYQEEIDVWNEERKGALHRDQLFQPPGLVKPGSVPRLLHEQKGIFTFLCQACFESKPQIISKRNPENPDFCTNPSNQHSFPDHNQSSQVSEAAGEEFQEPSWLVSMKSMMADMSSQLSANSQKTQQLQQAVADLAAKADGRQTPLPSSGPHKCGLPDLLSESDEEGLEEGEELKPEDPSPAQRIEPLILANRIQGSYSNGSKPEVNSPGLLDALPPSQLTSLLHDGMSLHLEDPRQSQPKSLDLKMKVCGQCLRNGREIEADRDGKYCTAKARHSWTKDKRVLLVMSKAKKKWVPIRPLPSIRSFPQQYEICVHVQNGKKCQYIGNCTFAHNTEEKDIWTFMKENKVLDLQLIFDLCNKNKSPAEKPGKAAAPIGAQKETEKQIVMPTDYGDLMDGFHCYLCGKNSNSERQWQKHIQSEKHKDRVFTLESEESPWKYRFPAGEFKLCERFEETQSCPNDNNCPFAHGAEELAEWHERRKVLQFKVSKARKDMLLEPSDSDFGKYSFLMQDLAEVSEERGTEDTL